MINYIVIILTTIAGLSTVIGSVLIFLPIKSKEKILSFGLGLAFIVMLLISVIDLIPNGLNYVLYKYNQIELFVLTLILGLFGLLIINLLNNKIKTDEELYRVGILCMLAIMIHNIPEGMITSLCTLSDVDLGFKMSFLIMLHNIPEGISISLPIYYATGNKSKAILLTLISGLGEIVGAIITILFLKPFITNFLLYILFIVTAGIMIYISIFEIFIKGFSYKKYISFSLGVGLGILILILTL